MVVPMSAPVEPPVFVLLRSDDNPPDNDSIFAPPSRFALKLPFAEYSKLSLGFTASAEPAMASSISSANSLVV